MWQSDQPTKNSSMYEKRRLGILQFCLPPPPLPQFCKIYKFLKWRLCWHSKPLGALMFTWWTFSNQHVLIMCKIPWVLVLGVVLVSGAPTLVWFAPKFSWLNRLRRVEANITNHLKDSIPTLEKYKAMQICLM